MAKRLFGLVWFAFEPFRKLPKLHVKVLNAPPDLLFLLRKTVITSADVNSWVKLLTTSLSTTFNAQTCLNAMLKSLTASFTLEASANGSIVITLARLTLTILQAQSIAEGSIVEQSLNFLSEQKNTIPKELDSRNYYRAVSCDYSTA
jgi:hypothetical protein